MIMTLVDFILRMFLTIGIYKRYSGKAFFLVDFFGIGGAKYNFNIFEKTLVDCTLVLELES